MNGSAPKSPATGSQVFVFQKLKPNFAIERCDSLQRTSAIPVTRRTTSAAKKPVPSRNPRSSPLRRGAGRFDIVRSCGAESLELDLPESLHLEGDDFLRKRRVAEIGAVLLPVCQSPVHEIDHDLRKLLVLRILVEEQPGKGADGIHTGAGCIRDRDAKVIGHGLG